MKKWVVVVERESGRVETRLVPAKSKWDAEKNCKNTGDKIVICEPYRGQDLRVSSQIDESEVRFRYGGYKFGYGFGYENDRRSKRRKG